MQQLISQKTISKKKALSLTHLKPQIIKKTKYEKINSANNFNNDYSFLFCSGRND